MVEILNYIDLSVSWWCFWLYRGRPLLWIRNSASRGVLHPLIISLGGSNFTSRCFPLPDRS